MKVIVSTDFDLDERMSHILREQFDAWLASDQEAIVLSAGVHATAQRADGTWVRICHHEADEAESVAVSEEG
jgi:hypothetical protein